MRLVYIKLINYIGIFNGGMNLSEIEIDLLSNQSKTILLSGNNGSGKSTLQRALTPIPDSNDNFVDKLPAEKHVTMITRDNVEYSMRLVHDVNKSGNRVSAKGYIQRCGIELNPGGSITKYKEILYDELGLDENYIVLSHISGESRGIVDMIPSQRKKYISSILNSIDTYNDMNKTFTKKANICKSHINGLEAKIRSLGNEQELRDNLVIIDKQYKFLNSERDRLLKEKTQAEDFITLTDKNGTIQAEYQVLYDNMKNTTETISNLSNKRQSLFNNYESDNSYNKSIEDSLKNITNLITSLNTQNEVHKSSIDKLIIDREDTSLSISSSQEKLNNLKNSSDMSNLQNAVDLLTKRIISQENIFKNSKITDYDTSQSEFLFIYRVLTQIKDFVDDLRKNYEYDCIHESIDSIKKNTSNELHVNIDKLKLKRDESKNELISLSTQIIEVQKDISNTSILEDRPSNCKIDSCPLIANALELMKKKPKERLVQLEETRYNLEKTIYKLNQTIPSLEILAKCIIDLNKIIEYISTNKQMLNKMDISYIFTNTEEFLLRLDNNNSFEEIDYSNKYIEWAEDIEDYRDNKSRLVELNSELKLARKEIQEVNELEASLLKSQEKYEKIISEINRINKEIVFNKTLIQEHHEKINILQQIQDIDNEISQLENTKLELKAKYETMKENISQIKIYIDNINTLSTRIHQVEQDLLPLSEEKDKINYALIALAQYNDEYNTYKNTYDKYNKLKLYSSPTNDSIQVLFIHEYMQRMLDLSNQILSLLFNGQYRLLDFDIDGDNFKIPFIGEGMRVDDVSSASTSQKCMVGMIVSLVLAYQASPNYGIARLDEVDGGLDSYNRGQFVEVLNRIIDILHLDQVFMISHNLEADLSNMGVIKLKSENSDLDYSNANILWDYNTCRNL